MKFVKVSVHALALVSASLVSEKEAQKSVDDSKDKLRNYLAQNQTDKKPVVEPKGSPNPKPKRMCCVSVI